MVGRGVLAAALLISACGSSDAQIDASFGRAAGASVTTPPSTTDAPAATSTTTTSSSTSTTTTTVPAPAVVVPASTTTAPTTAPQTTAPTTTAVPVLPPIEEIPATGPPADEPIDPWFSTTDAAFERLASGNTGASMTVARGGEIVFSRASGTTLDGRPATGDTPFVVASVSKLVVGIVVARLHQHGLLDIGEVVPWGEIGIWPANGWSDVTLSELISHSAGVPVARSTWFSGGTVCEEHIVGLVSSPPRGHRGTWTYSNGNYCLLGMVVSARTGLPLDQVAQQLVFDPVGAEGVHLTLGGLLPGDMMHPHRDGVGRLSRLGGAGTMVVSTDDLALAVGRLSPDDLAVVTRGVYVDQYGFGHTGTVDGAKACTWVLDGGRTVVAATIAGDGRPTGGAVCDLVVPAVASDLGIAAGTPKRTPAS